MVTNGEVLSTCEKLGVITEEAELLILNPAVLSVAPSASPNPSSRTSFCPSVNV